MMTERSLRGPLRKIVWFQIDQTFRGLQSSDGVPGKLFDARNRRDADALDSESDHCVESRPSMLETVVRRAFRRRERLFALDAPVATAFAGSRSVESVPNDVPGLNFPMERTCGIETSSILQFGSALVDERSATLEIGLKLKHAEGLHAGCQHLIAEAPRTA